MKIPPDQAAQGVEKALLRYAKGYEKMNEPAMDAAKADLLTLMYRENLAVIGEDEIVPLLPANAKTFDIVRNAQHQGMADIENAFRARLRQAAALRYRQKEGDGNTEAI